MSLLEIKRYLSTVKIASLANLCAYFQCESDYLRHMLGHWVQKGCVRQCKKTPNCGVKCGQCNPLVTEIYEWVA
jgi:putative ferrous iron transport protein C